MTTKHPFVRVSGGNFSNYKRQDQLRTIFGGNINSLDPYTTGYHYLYITMPEELKNKNYGEFLTTVCQSVTIPGITVNNIEYTGLNNFKWNYPGTVEYDNQRFTAKFIEFANLPILTIMGQWVNIFRNMIYGVSNKRIKGPKQRYFKGSALYASTLFDGVSVQYAAHFTGIYPTKIPTDAFGSDKATHDKVEHEIEFAFDMMYTGEEVVERAQKQVNATYDNSVGANGGATMEYMNSAAGRGYSGAGSEE